MTSHDSDNNDGPPATVPGSNLSSYLKLIASAALLVSSIRTYQSHASYSSSTYTYENSADASARRRLSSLNDGVPSYMNDLMTDLDERKKLFDETPPDEVKYWFEYTGPLQVRHVCSLKFLPCRWYVVTSCHFFLLSFLFLWFFTHHHLIYVYH